MNKDDKNDEEPYMPQIPADDLVDDTNTIEGQLISSKPVPRLSRHFAAQIKKYLSGADYPATKSELYDTALRQGADSPVLEAISGLLQDSYESFEDLNKELETQARSNKKTG